MNASIMMVKLLGEPQVRINNRYSNVRRRKTRALIFYLAAHRLPVSRDELASIIWPNQDNMAAQHSLSVTQYEVRKKYPQLLVVNNEQISLSPDVEVDVRLFGDLLSRQNNDLVTINEALQLYDGEFLQGFDLPDCPDFAAWQQTEKEKYSRLAVRGLTQAAELYEKKGNFHQALDYYKQALELDPLQEYIHCACMRLHYLSGNRPGAIRQYQKLCQLLSDEIGLPPMPQTVKLYEAIITDTLTQKDDGRWPSSDNCLVKHTKETIGTATNIATMLPFVGREKELRTIREWVENRAGFIYVSGSPGIGKTRLVEEFASSTEALVLYGVARELEQAHWNPKAWAELAIALKQAKFKLVNRYVVQAENPSSVHINGLKSLKHDAILVLAPVEANIFKQWQCVKEVNRLDSYQFCKDCASALGWILQHNMDILGIEEFWLNLIRTI